MSAVPADLAANPLLSTWFCIAADGTIEFHTGKVELGQGAISAIAAMVAEELRIPVRELRVVAGDTRVVPDEGLTASSVSIEQGGRAARWAAAELRTRFVEAAAAILDCPVEEVALENGHFFRTGHNRRLSYADLRDRVPLDLSVLERPQPAFLGCGHSLQTPRLDLPEKLAGASFLHDLDLPGLHHGRVLRPLYAHGELVGLDRAAIEGLPGVVSLVVDGNFVGLVARSEIEAERALEVLGKVTRWRRARPLSPADDENLWMEAVKPLSITQLAGEPGPIPADESASTHEAAYSRPYIAHAAIAPSCAAASWSGDRLAVWSHTQGAFFLKGELARHFEVDPSSVDVIHAMGAGCYGHNGADDVALDAALLARAAGVPVLCRWSRRDEMVWSPFGAAMRVRISATLNETGRIAQWSHDVFSPPHLGRPHPGDGINLLAAWHLDMPRRPSRPRSLPGSGAGDRNAVPIYEMGARRITHHMLPQGPLRSSSLRSLGAHGNVFAIESFMDELAGIADADPVEFRLRHLTDARGRATLEAAAASADWSGRPASGDGAGWGCGLARYKNTGAWCAVIAKIELSHEIRLVSMHAAVDCGAVISRDGVLNQIEGGIVQAASWTLKEQVRWDDDGVLTQDWESYPVLRFSECPAIVVELIDRPGEPPLGAGECTTGPTAAAIGNAVAHAVGVRIRHMPITADRIAAAIHAS